MMRVGHVNNFLRICIIATVCVFALMITVIRPPGQSNVVYYDVEEGGEGRPGDLLTSSVSDGGRVINATDAITLLSSTMRILCICSTTGPRHAERAIHVKNTWGKRCTKLIFASDEIDETLPSLKFAEKSGREYVTFKLRAALRWVHDNELNNFDWLLKADDDTFVVMEHLQAFLTNYNPKDDHYFGRHFSVPHLEIGKSFVSGSAYILSPTTLHRLVTEAQPNATICPEPMLDAHEDLDLGYCLFNIGIKPDDTRDELGRQRFLVFSAWLLLLEGSAGDDNWIRSYDKYKYVEGENCCADTAIALHYVPGGYMLALEYFLYRIRAAGSSPSFLAMLPRTEGELKQKLIANGYELMAALPRPLTRSVSTASSTTSLSAGSGNSGNVIERNSGAGLWIGLEQRLRVNVKKT